MASDAQQAAVMELSMQLQCYKNTFNEVSPFKKINYPWDTAK
jgi:hypothetical protein